MEIINELILPCFRAKLFERSHVLPVPYVHDHAVTALAIGSFPDMQLECSTRIEGDREAGNIHPLGFHLNVTIASLACLQYFVRTAIIICQ